MSKEEKKDPFDGDYIGNIWGWKFSFIGMGLLVLLMGMMAYRHYTMGVPFGLDPEGQSEQTEQLEENINETKKDSVNLD